MPRIYVGNLPRSVTESALAERLRSARCSVSQVRLIRDLESGNPRGFAVVELANREDVLKAVQELNERPIAGRPLFINEARPQRVFRASTSSGRAVSGRLRRAGDR